MIGLRRHTVKVVDHDPSWSELFNNEAEDLHRTLGDLVADVQHVGSTAVRGLPAKPILDIAMAVHRLDLIPKIVERLTNIGYIYRGDGGDDGGHLFVKEPEPNFRTAHLHVVELSDHQWKDYLTFREILRNDPNVRKKYGKLKQDLARRFPHDRKSYTSAKDKFIEQFLRETY